MLSADTTSELQILRVTNADVTQHCCELNVDSYYVPNSNNTIHKQRPCKCIGQKQKCLQTVLKYLAGVPYKRVLVALFCISQNIIPCTS